MFTIVDYLISKFDSFIFRSYMLAKINIFQNIIFLFISIFLLACKPVELPESSKIKWQQLRQVPTVFIALAQIDAANSNQHNRFDALLRIDPFNIDTTSNFALTAQLTGSSKEILVVLADYLVEIIFPTFSKVQAAKLRDKYLQDLENAQQGSVEQFNKINFRALAKAREELLPASIVSKDTGQIAEQLKEYELDLLKAHNLRLQAAVEILKKWAPSDNKVLTLSEQKLHWQLLRKMPVNLIALAQIDKASADVQDRLGALLKIQPFNLDTTNNFALTAKLTGTSENVLAVLAQYIVEVVLPTLPLEQAKQLRDKYLENLVIADKNSAIEFDRMDFDAISVAKAQLLSKLGIYQSSGTTAEQLKEYERKLLDTHHAKLKAAMTILRSWNPIGQVDTVK